MSNIEDAANREIAGLELELTRVGRELSEKILENKSRAHTALERLRDLMAHVQACTTCGGMGHDKHNPSSECMGCGGHGERMGPQAAALFQQVRDLIKLFDETETKAEGAGR